MLLSLLAGAPPLRTPWRCGREDEVADNGCGWFSYLAVSFVLGLPVDCGCLLSAAGGSAVPQTLVAPHGSRPSQTALLDKPWLVVLPGSWSGSNYIDEVFCGDHVITYIVTPCCTGSLGPLEARRRAFGAPLVHGCSRAALAARASGASSWGSRALLRCLLAPAFWPLPPWGLWCPCFVLCPIFFFSNFVGSFQRVLGMVCHFVRAARAFRAWQGELQPRLCCGPRS